MGSKSLVNGKRVGLTRNQKRKQAYATLSASARGVKKVVIAATGGAGGKLRKLNHKRGIAAAAKAKRRTEGDARNEAWRKLTAEQQIASLDSRLGVGVGAVRQRARIAAGPAKAKVAVPVQSDDSRVRRIAKQKTKEAHDRMREALKRDNTTPR